MRSALAAFILTALLNGQAIAAPAACELIPAAEMSAILGSTVTAVADNRGAQTKCTYEAQGGELGGPYAELELSWGDGYSGMKGAGAMEPELGKVMGHLAGLGDQATSVGPMILIRRSNDLITMVISGVRDQLSVAKRIYGLLNARLPPSAAQ
jgi:hypothetical protein